MLKDNHKLINIFFPCTENILGYNFQFVHKINFGPKWIAAIEENIRNATLCIVFSLLLFHLTFKLKTYKRIHKNFNVLSIISKDVTSCPQDHQPHTQSSVLRYLCLESVQ